MGFFKDFKDDLSEAVNGLTTEEKEDIVEQTTGEKVVVNSRNNPEPEKNEANYKEELNQSTTETVTTNNTVSKAKDTRIETSIYEEPVAVDLSETMVSVETNDGNNILNHGDNMMGENAVNNNVDVENTDVLEDDVMVDASEEEEIVDETAIITEGLCVSGNLDSKGSIDIFGQVTGDVTCRGKLTVSGTLSGNSKANEIFMNSAKIDGNIEAKGSVKVGQGTVIVGNITSTSAVIAGAVKGDIDVHGPVIVDSTAIIVGDIKSKSVQINNGATIDGRCSQCYAEGNPAAIFDQR